MIKEEDWRARYHDSAVEKRRKKRRRQRRFRRFCTVLVLLALLTGWFFWQQEGLSTETITVESAPDGFSGYRIAVISDLHGKEVGEGNQRLLNFVAGLEPDLIAVVGDILHEESQMAMIPAVAEGLAAIAPTYYVTGNHEWAIGGVPELKKALESCGVTVLSNRAVVLERNGDTAVLAGIDDPNGYADQKTPEELAAEVHAQYGDAFRMLLAHRNDRFPTQYSLLGADIVFSGHGHGGVIRLPFTDGLLSTDRTLFPSYTAGLYQENSSVLFATRGLGNSGPTFRLFNRPEIAIVTLHKS